MIFTINHIDPKSDSQSKTKFFSKSSVVEKDSESLTEDFARISSLGIILSRSGLDNKRSRFINSGDSIKFHLFFSFKAGEELLVKGLYLMQSGQLEIDGQGKICNSKSLEAQEWQEISFYMSLDNVQPKQILLGRLKPNIHDQFLSLCRVFSKETVNKNDESIPDYKVVLKRGTKSDQLLEELIFNIFAIGQLNKISLKRIKDKLNSPNEHINAYGINVENILDKITNFKWDISKIPDPNHH